MVFWVAHGFSVPKCSYLKTFGTQRVSSINSFASRKLRSRGSTGRSALTPSGNQSFESVKSGNLIANRTLCLLWVAAALQCWWILEQPKNSLMQDLPAFQAFMKHVTTLPSPYTNAGLWGTNRKRHLALLGIPAFYQQFVGLCAYGVNRFGGKQPDLSEPWCLPQKRKTPKWFHNNRCAMCHPLRKKRDPGSWLTQALAMSAPQA